MRHTFDEQLQISEFIKDPASLKLLILAGTNIRANELVTVNKCVSLIKLDLSSNQLAELPLKFLNFPHMKILYLHDNRITAVTIGRTNLEYLTLFDNPIANYRAPLIAANEKLMAVDHHVVTRSERVVGTEPRVMAALKWPIVEISQSLEHQEDYLNLLKAELFVISQVYKRANFADTLNRYFLALRDVVSFANRRLSLTNQAFFHQQFIETVAQHWRDYTRKKAKLRRLFDGTPAEELLLSKLERVRRGRSAGVTEVLQRFLKSVRERMVARLVLARSLAAYRSHIPAFRQLQSHLQQHPLKLHFLLSQVHMLQKLFLYVKKQFFNAREFDILDNFDQLVVKNKRSYYIFRRRERDNRDAVLLQMVRNAMGLVLGEKGVDKRAVLYNRQGHKRIQIKRVKKGGEQWDKERAAAAWERVEQQYQRYDTLIEYQFKNKTIYQNVLRLIKYFNAGNSHLILKNQAAYFQTEVVFEDQTLPKERIFFTCHQYFVRVLAANNIQKWWRRMRAVKNSQRNIFRQIRVSRAQKLIGRWLRDLTFRHRIQLGKVHSFTKCSFKDVELLMQLDIYMQLPVPNDLLRFKCIPLRTDVQVLYELLHRNSEVEIVEVSARSWIKFKYLSPQDAFQTQKQFSLLTYRYYFNGTYLRLFAPHQLTSTKDLVIYESRVEKLFQVKVSVGETQGRVAKRIEIDNVQPYFIWPYLDQAFAGMFKAEEAQSLPISVFIYNKNRRPLKVNCDLMWITPPTLYYFRRKPKPQMRVRTPKKEKQIQSALEHYMPHIQHKLRRERQFSMKQHKSLMQANRERGNSQHVQLSLLSQTLNIKRQ